MRFMILKVPSFTYVFFLKKKIVMHSVETPLEKMAISVCLESFSGDFPGSPVFSISNARGSGLIPGQGIEISYAERSKLKKKKILDT